MCMNLYTKNQNHTPTPSKMTNELMNSNTLLFSDAYKTSKHAGAPQIKHAKLTPNKQLGGLKWQI